MYGPDPNRPTCPACAAMTDREELRFRHAVADLDAYTPGPVRCPEHRPATLPRDLTSEEYREGCAKHLADADASTSSPLTGPTSGCISRS